MRKQFVKTTEDIFEKDERLVLLLGDIGVFGFRNSFKKYPDRIFNIGILEQATIGVAAGLAMNDLIPVVHTIAPFMVERALEQIKNDFGYQHLGGNFISIGASYDYASLGGTHHCPGDIGVLKNVPEIEIVIPGSQSEFDQLFKEIYSNNKPSYFRLSEKTNQESYAVKFGKANVIKKGNDATIIAIGPMLESIIEACKDLDVTILYYTTISPFDKDTLKNNLSGQKLIVCEPYYSGAIAVDILDSLKETASIPKILHIGVPREFIHNYGKVEEIDKHLKLSTDDIKKRIFNFI